jgi:hypothetical protein
MRRNLQREHLQRVATALVRPPATLHPNARALMRENARLLVALLNEARAKPGLSKESRAHYADGANSLEQALKASLQRTGV